MQHSETFSLFTCAFKMFCKTTVTTNELYFYTIKVVTDILTPVRENVNSVHMEFLKVYTLKF